MSIASARPAELTEMIAAQDIHGEVLDPATGNVWQSIGPISRDDYAGLPLEPGWLRVGVGRGAMDEHWFERSPGADVDGPMELREIGGHRFGLCARPLGVPTRADGAGGPLHVSVEKHHVIRFAAGREVPILVRTDGEGFVHVVEGGAGTRALALPDGWQLETVQLAEDWVVHLPTPTTALFFSNGDSYQGPIAALPSERRREPR